METVKTQLHKVIVILISIVAETQMDNITFITSELEQLKVGQSGSVFWLYYTRLVPEEKSKKISDKFSDPLVNSDTPRNY